MHQDQVLFPCWISCGPCHWESSKFQLIKVMPEMCDQPLVINYSVICYVVYSGPAGAQGETMRGLNTGCKEKPVKYTRMGWYPRTGGGQRLMIRTAVNELKC